MQEVKGDRLSSRIENLLPETTYFFKVQARNKKGYGPISPAKPYRTAAYGQSGAGSCEFVQTVSMLQVLNGSWKVSV